VSEGGDGRWTSGLDGVRKVLTPIDKKAEFIHWDGHVLGWVRSALGYPAAYSLEAAPYEGPAEAILMDLDGTSVHSEKFWVWIIESTTARLVGHSGFSLEEADLPHVMGHSVSEHLSYCIRKYAPGKTLEQARAIYFEVVDREMAAIMEGRGRQDAFEPAPFLKDFLLILKGRGVKVGLVTSGLHAKAWPEILSAFRQLNLGDPLEFYDAIITAGTTFGLRSTGTLGELSPKPHPWLYAETGRIGLGMDRSLRHRVLGVEDSSAGVLAVRLAGYPCVGIAGGNIEQAGYGSLVLETAPDLERILELALG
jgi:beta-phosphoglucomutase-like phosphatase (HAD superfamily)